MRRYLLVSGLAIVGIAQAMEPVSEKPPCEKIAIYLSGRDTPVLVVDSYFTYHFDGALFAVRQIDSLASLPQCTEIVDRLESGRKRRNELATDAASAAEPYKTDFERKLGRTETQQGMNSLREILAGSVAEVSARAKLQPAEACALKWGELNANYGHNAVTFSNRVRVELPRCLAAPTRIYRQPQ